MSYALKASNLIASHRSQPAHLWPPPCSLHWISLVLVQAAVEASSTCSLEGPVIQSGLSKGGRTPPPHPFKPRLLASTLRHFPDASSRLGAQQFALTARRTWRVISKQASADQLMTGQSCHLRDPEPFGSCAIAAKQILTSGDGSRYCKARQRAGELKRRQKQDVVKGWELGALAHTHTHVYISTHIHPALTQQTC